MGSLCSKQTSEDAFNSALRLNQSLVQTLKGLGLDHKHLFALHQIFTAMDKDKSGEIDMLEFFDYIDIKRSRFSEKAFSVMDRNGSGEVDFVEFVLAVWNYCSFNHASLVRFAFDLYDVDGSGEIEHSEVVRCVREVWGSAWETSSAAQKIIGKLDAIMEGTSNNRLSMAQFQEFSIRHPMLLFPAFELQMEIQRKVLGQSFWSRATANRKSVDVRQMKWDHVKEVTLLSRQTSSNLLTMMEEDAERQLEVKSLKMTSSWRRRGSKLVSFPRSSLTRTFVSSKASHDDSEAAAVATAAAVAASHAKVENARRRSSGTSQVAVTTGQTGRRQSAPTAPPILHGTVHHEDLLEDIE